MKRLLARIARRVAARVLAPVLDELEAREGGPATRQLQVLLQLRYRDLLARGGPFPSLGDVGFRVYSGTDEDGILLYILTLAGMPTRRVVDIGCANVRGSNAANLIIHHGFSGLLVDGRADVVRAAEASYRRYPETTDFPPTLACEWITADNVDAIIVNHGFGGEIDLLSIDIDGMDYWIWKAIRSVSPRVVVIEYQDILGPARSLVVPYAAGFSAGDYAVNRASPDYCGASLRAMTTLARDKGYRLVGSNRFGYNAFFVRQDVAGDALPEVSVESCFSHPRTQWGLEHRFPRVKDMPWLEVS